MGHEKNMRIGLLVGEESDWPKAFMAVVSNRSKRVEVGLVKLGGTSLNSMVEYDIIVDRMSHVVPYYRAYLKHAAFLGCRVVNDPFTWAADDKFMGLAMAHKLGMTTPRTVVLPNKEVTRDLGPGSFRNLVYPMDWQGIVEYVGVPAIFKDVHSGGRIAADRVKNVGELIQRYDESDTHTMVLQQIIESDIHVHGFVIGQEKVMLLNYSRLNDRYESHSFSAETQLGREIIDSSLALTRAYGYDINMVEFVIKDEVVFVINSTNPAPMIDLRLMNREQFDWCVEAMVTMVLDKAARKPTTSTPFNL